MKVPERKADFAVFLHSPSGGGAQRRTVTLVNGFAARGYEVDLVFVTASGPLRSEISDRVRVIELTNWHDRHALARLPRRLQLLLAVPRLARYLRVAPAGVLLSAGSLVHVPAILARRLARSPIPVVLRLSNHLTRTRKDGKQSQSRTWAVILARWLFHDARAAIAVSHGVADDLVHAIGFSRARMQTIYNPVQSQELQRRAEMPLDHPWFKPGEPPVILGVGRLVRQKDFPTLLRAFARVRAQRPARLLILGRTGKGRRRRFLLRLIEELGVAADVGLGGYVDNPAPYMRRASLFALSSAWEGLPGVLIEAMACGCPVVSTDCPSGPSEILEGGRLGRLVPVGDDAALAEAILATLDSPPSREMLLARAQEFTVDRAVDRYIAALLGARTPLVEVDGQSSQEARFEDAQSR